MDPPVPIPNTVVKHLNVESTWVETPWEDRKLPVKQKALMYMSAFFVWKKLLKDHHKMVALLENFHDEVIFPGFFA